MHVVSQIPTFLHIIEGIVNEMNVMDEYSYELYGYYLFDRGYFDPAKFFTITLIRSNLVRGKEPT